MEEGGREGRWGVERSVIIISNRERGLAWPIPLLFTARSASVWEVERGGEGGRIGQE